MRSYALGALLALVFTASADVSAELPVAATALTADLSRYYFKTPVDEVAARAELNSALAELSGFKGQLTSSHQLLSALRQFDAVQKLFARHERYLHLSCARDRKSVTCDADKALQSDFDAKTAFLDPEILAIPEERLRAFLKQEPTLGAYRFAIADIRRDGSHTLPEPEQKWLDEFQPQIADWQFDLYEQIVAGISFGTVKTASGDLDVVRQRNLIATDLDGRVREEGFKRRYAGFASRRDLLAFTLVQTVRAQTLLAKTHRYADAPARKYESLYCKPKETRTLLNAMAQAGDVPKRYEKIRLYEIEQGYPQSVHEESVHQQAHAWDVSLPAPGLTPPTTSLADVRAVLHDAFASLGKEYQSQFDALIDPANGRADILPGGAPNRYGGGFSVGAPGSASVLFFGRYDGTFKDLSVIAHEGGHAVHRQLMSDNGVNSFYANGPHFLFESFAIFNELVLADFMAEHAATPELQRYYRERWLSIKGLDMFYGAEDALLEQAIYDGVTAGTVRNADDLDALTLKIDGQFSQFPATTPELRNRWATISLMYEDPLYDVNYVHGGLLALKYYDLYTTKREWFLPRYVALLKNGFDGPPAEMLRQFLGIDLAGDALLKDDLGLLNRRLDQLDASLVGK